MDNSVYFYDFHSSRTEVLFHSPSSAITAIKFSPLLNTLSIGTSSGLINFIDLVSLKYSKYLHHRSRVGIVEITGNEIITGSRDRKSKLIDLRTHRTEYTFTSHIQEVCGLKLNRTGKYLASGGNDNKVFIFDMRNMYIPIEQFNEHYAAVRAISWSPHSDTELVTGGGSADKTIKQWDISRKREMVGSYEFESQICNLRWLRSNRIVSTFGYSNNDIKLLEEFKPIKRYTGHKNRVIHFAVEEEERYFVSGSKDTEIKVWEIEKRDEQAELKMR